MAEAMPPHPRRPLFHLGNRGFLILFAAMFATATIIRLTGWHIPPIPAPATNTAATVNASTSDTNATTNATTVMPITTAVESIRFAESQGLIAGVRPHTAEKRIAEDGTVTWEVRQYVTDTDGNVAIIDAATRTLLRIITWSGSDGS